MQSNRINTIVIDDIVTRTRNLTSAAPRQCRKNSRSTMFQARGSQKEKSNVHD